MRHVVSGFTLAILVLALRSAFAEPISYAGKVVDAAGVPLPWALLKIEGSAIIGQSGADGTFSLAGEAATVFWPDPQPPGFGDAPKAGPPAFYRPDGRATVPDHVASTLLLMRSRGDRPASRAVGLANAARAVEWDIRPPEPPVLARTTTPAWTLSVAMANYQPGAFAQSATSAKGLVLTLAKSATDTATWAAEKKLCLDTINALRAGLSLPKLAWSKSLEAFADQGARYDAERNKAHAHFGAFSVRAVPSDAENAIPGWPLKNYKTVAKVVHDGAKMMWDEGPSGGHYENIKGSHTQVGCGIYVTPSGGVWVIHDFK